MKSGYSFFRLSNITDFIVGDSNPLFVKHLLFFHHYDVDDLYLIVYSTLTSMIKLDY